MANPTFIHGGINTNGDIAVTNAEGIVQYTIDNESGTNGQVLTLDSSNVASWTDLPTLFDGDYNSLTNLPTLFDGDYNSLTNLPTLFDGDYGSLANVPSTFTPSAHTHPISNITNLQSELDSKIPSSEKGAANGVATLDSNGLVPSSQLPSYVDDVLEYANEASFPATGETGKLYVDLSNNSVHRWSGSTYIDITDYSTPGHTHEASEITDFDTEVDNQIAAASVGDLSDVDISGVANEQVLAWNSGNSQFEPINVSSLSTSDSVSSLTDTTIGTLSANEILVYTGSEWENKPISYLNLVVDSDIANMVETTDSVTVLSDVTNIGSDGDLIVNNGGNLEGASTISHDKISDFDTEAAAIADTQIAAASIDDLNDVGAPSGSNQNGDVLVWDTNQWVPRTASTQVITSDSATSLTDISFDLDGSNKAAIQVDYVMTSATSIRAGIIHAITNGSSYEISDLSTIHAGTESQLPEFSAANAGGGDLGVKVQWANGYTIKYTVQNLLR